MVIFRKVKELLYRQIVTAYDAEEFAKEFTFAQSELLFFVKDDVDLRSLNDHVHSEILTSLHEIIPSAESIAANQLSETSNDIMCIRCFSTRSDGYLTYGAKIWLRIRGKWKHHNLDTNRWIHSKNFPDEKFSITCCGCCGDVNTFYHFDEVSDYYFVY